jgi:RHS repeat-associated protein
VKAQIDERGNRTEFRYDGAGRQVEIIYADDTPATLTDNPRTKSIYDVAGQRVTEIDALNRTTSFKYDDLGRLFKTEFQDKTFTSQEYDSLGRRVAAFDQEGKRTEYRYDDLGRLTGVKNALGDLTTYAYNSVGNLITITDAESHTTRYEYDGVGRRTATILPMNQRAGMTYNAVGNLKTQTDFNGRVITYNYDPMNRMNVKQFQDGSKVTYAYTAVGLQDIVKFVDASGATTASYDYDYDVRDRQIQRTDNIGGVSRSIGYTYDVAGNRTSVTTASGTVNYTFDVRNRLDKVIENSVVTADYDYNAVSNLISTTFANGTQENRQYDELNRFKYLENRKGNNTISSYTYTLDKVGNRKKVVENTGRVVDYLYDDLYRLTEEKITDGVNGNRVYDYTYDKVGNRKIKTEIVNGVTKTTSYEYDANDRLLNEKVDNVIAVSYTYDNNGSTLTKTDSQGTTNYVWNDEKRLVQATVNGTQVKYTYNDQGIRVSSTVNGVETRYLLNGGQLANVWEEYRPNGTVSVEYVYGNDLISQTQGNQTTYYHVDSLGSTRILTDDQGIVAATYNYDVYGELINSTSGVENKYLFAGEQYDEALGDYYNRARYYDTDAGRFTRRDDYEGRREEPLTLHKYIYANDNPVSYIDPSGLVGFLTRDKLKELGNNIHETIGRDFILNHPLRRADLPGKNNGLSILKILTQADDLPNGNPLANMLQPDLADYATREIYEIKSRSQFSEGTMKMLLYIAALNRAPGQTNEWEEGSSYTYTHNPIVLNYGKIAIVHPPVSGVITYSLLDDPNKLKEMSSSAAITAMALLIALVVAASARSSLAGAAGLV